MKIDVQILWRSAAIRKGDTAEEFARLILEEAAKACELTVAASTKRGSAAICAAAVRALKP